jgi:hypothetical protein
VLICEDEDGGSDDDGSQLSTPARADAAGGCGSVLYVDQFGASAVSVIGKQKTYLAPQLSSSSKLIHGHVLL